MRTDEIEVAICDRCAPLIVNGDETGLPDDPDEQGYILANADTLHRPCYLERVTDGYADCWVCGETVIEARIFSAEVLS